MLRKDAIAGAGNTYDFGARLLSSLYGSWFSIDPLAGKYPSFSPYVAMGNNPISFVEPDGREAIVYIKKNTLTFSTTIYIYGSGATKDIAKLMQKNIMNAWSKDSYGKNWQYYDDFTGNTYDIVIDVKVALLNPSDHTAEPSLGKITHLILIII